MRLVALVFLLLVAMPPGPTTSSAGGQGALMAALVAARPWLLMVPILISLRVPWPSCVLGGLCLVGLTVITGLGAESIQFGVAVLGGGWLLASLTWINSPQPGARTFGKHNDH
ncbi:MAG: hypothetical protein IT318_26040 [Anaerolineales bacterium]|nr:hypothetical protein [Anaerolineales bacterium]